MPARSQSQQTGDAAVPRWQILLEPRYVFRPETPDYGIDGEVEEFDADDRATGLRYKVQLKSTEEQDLGRALRVHIPFSTANYWRAHDLPVLLVRYHLPSDRFYVRWFHTFDPYYGGVGKTGITFRWQDGDEWHDGRAEELAAEARAFLEMRSNRLRLPFSFSLEVSGAVSDFSEPEIRIALRAAARGRGDVVRLLDRGAKPGEGRLIVTPEQLAVDLGGVTTATMHLPAGFPTGGADQIAIDLLSLTALAFEYVGQADVAGRLAASYLAQSDVLEHPEAPWALSSAMARARQIHAALELADRIDQHQSGEEPSVWFTLPVLFHSGSLSDRERSLAVEVLSRRIERRRERGDSLGEARACVNLGNFFRNRGEPAAAIPLYERALDRDPVYAQRPHYWEEKAGVLFGAHRYSEAAETYGRALDLGARSFVRALQADALMFAGRYREAQSLWQRFLGEMTIRARGAEYALKLDLVEDIIEVIGIDEQVRELPDLTEPLIDSDEPPDPAEARAVALAALRRDALDPRGWQVLAWVALVQEDLPRYVRYLRAVACLLEGDPGAWAEAVATNFGVPGGALVPEMLVTGERLTDGALLPTLADFARECVDAEERAGWLTEIERLYRSIPAESEEGSFAIRFLREDGSVSEIGMPGAESNEHAG